MPGNLPKAFNRHKDILKGQLVLIQNPHEKSTAWISVTVSPPEETMENFVRQDEIHTESTAKQRKNCNFAS